MVAHYARPAQQRAFAAQGLAAGPQHNCIIAPVDIRSQPPAAIAEHAGGMRIVCQQHRAMAIRQIGKFGNRCTVAVHAVERFDRDPGLARGIAGPPMRERFGKGADIIVRHRNAFGPRQTHPFVRAGMDQRVVEDRIAALGQCRQQHAVRAVAIGEEQRAFAAEEARGLRLQRLVFGMVTAQQPRTARTDGNPALECVHHGVLEPRAARQREVIVRGEIGAAGKRQAAQPRRVRQPRQIVDLRGKRSVGGAPRIHAARANHRAARLQLLSSIGFCMARYTPRQSQSPVDSVAGAQAFLA